MEIQFDVVGWSIVIPGFNVVPINVPGSGFKC
jgi:hypothetical protein